MNIIRFIRDEKMIGGQLSSAQETALRLFYGLGLVRDEQRAVARRALGVERLARAREHSEATFICGRRWGKTDRLAANIAVYEAVAGGHERYLSRGERGHVVLVAQDLRGVRVLFSYIQGKLEHSPVLSRLVSDIRRDEIELTNGLTISVFPPTFRAARGFSIPVAVLDECAFYRVEGANVDREVVRAIRPAQLTFPNRKLIKVSTPYARAGILWEDFRQRLNKAKHSHLLVFQSPTWEGNPSLPRQELERERAADPDAFRREYGAEFTDQLAQAFDGEAVEECVRRSRLELAPRQGIRYVGAADPSGGGADEFAVTVCHRRGDVVVQDVIRGWRARRPEEAVQEAARLFRSYGITTVTGDRYAGQWVVDAFRRHGIAYRYADITASEAFLELLPLINQGSIHLLDDPTQTAQLLALERRRGRAGRDSLGHPAGGHDDRANVLALAAYAFRRQYRAFVIGDRGVMTADSSLRKDEDGVFGDSMNQQRWDARSGWSRQEREALSRQRTKEDHD